MFAGNGAKAVLRTAPSPALPRAWGAGAGVKYASGLAVSGCLCFQPETAAVHSLSRSRGRVRVGVCSAAAMFAGNGAKQFCELPPPPQPAPALGAQGREQGARRVWRFGLPLFSDGFRVFRLRPLQNLRGSLKNKKCRHSRVGGNLG